MIAAQWRPWPMLTLRRGRVEMIAVWNWPVVALTYGRWRYRPEDDPRRWFVRCRIGPVKVEGTGWR